MGRPRTYGNRTNTAIRLPEDLHVELVNAAAERDLSANYLVTAAVRDYLARLIPVDELTLTRQNGTQ